MELGNGLDDVLDAERAHMSHDVYEIGSMLSYEERLLLHWAARTAEAGAIVDLGAFLGGSTLALARGAESRDARVYSYDLFLLAGDWERNWLPEPDAIAIGDSTRPVVEANLAGVLDRVVLREGFVENHGWSDGPIGVLFVDIAKSWNTGDFVWQTFLPALVPGALVIQQDLVHWGHPWCAIAMESLSEHFEYLGWTWYSSAVYRCTSPVPAPAPLLESLSCEQMLTYLERTAERVGEPAAGSVRLSGAVVLGAFGRFDEARALVAEVASEYDNARLAHIEEGFAHLIPWIDQAQAAQAAD